MELKYNLTFKDKTIVAKLKRFINQIYKLLPCREEGTDWEKLLLTIIEEFSGLKSLMESQYEDEMFTVICKLEGLRHLTNSEDFMMYRKTIFECLNLVQEVINNLCQDQIT